MAANKSFVMLISLLTSGYLLCAAIQLTEEQIREVGPNFVRRDDCAVGIHLGTTYSSVAKIKRPLPRTYFCSPYERECLLLPNSDGVEIVKNERGSTTTPSCVAFTDSRVLIGESAKDQAHLNPERTICGINRLIGKGFDDQDVQAYIKTLPYKVVNKENKPHVEVKFKNGETKLFSPEEISALILGKMKQIAEAYMGDEIEDAVVLVHPSYYKNEISRPIAEAGKMAGIDSLSVVSSEFASILSRGGRLWARKNMTVLVYNLGGSAFDVSVKEVAILDDGWFHPTTSRKDVNLGGETFDTRVVDYFVSLIKSKYNKDISSDLSALTKLRIECEKAKISLSSRNRVMIKIDSLADGIIVFEEPLTRETFEDLNMDLFNRTIELVRDVMNEVGGIEKSQVDEIVLVGGNTRIPKIRSMLKELFGKEPLKDVNPEEAAAFAATFIAGESLLGHYLVPVDK